MGEIKIQKIGITRLHTDAIVNAANSGLWAGSGVCGAIFREAGHAELEAACNKIGHCEEGEAVITPGFKLKAKYIIHAVGPRWSGGYRGEEQRLYSCYQSALRLAEENGCTSIGFPLISAGIFGYPKREAWRVAIQSVRDYLNREAKGEMTVVFAVLEDAILDMGMEELG